ncbi:hypothetical protein ABPG74_020947 [Tetrahymena malaccensis]
MKNTINLIQHLKNINCSNQPVSNSLNDLLKNLQQISDFIKKFELSKKKYCDEYFSQVQTILRDLQDYLQVQQQSKNFNPSILPAPYQNLFISLNLTKSTESQSQGVVNELKRCVNDLILIKSQIQQSKNENNEQIKTLTAQILLDEEANKQKQKQIETEDLYLKSEKFKELKDNLNSLVAQLLNNSQLLEQIQNECIVLTKEKQECQKILDQLTQKEKEKNQIEQEIRSQIVKCKNEYDEIQKKISQEKENYLNKLKAQESQLIQNIKQDYDKQYSQEQQQIQSLEIHLQAIQQEKQMICSQLTLKNQENQEISEQLTNIENQIEDQMVQIKNIKHKIQLSEQDIKFHRKQIKDNYVLYEINPIVKRLSQQNTQFQDLQKQSQNIEEVYQQLTSVEKEVQQKIKEIEHFIDNAKAEMKKLFSVIWQLKGKSSQLLILFSLFFQNSKFLFSQNPSYNLSQLLQIQLEKAEQFNSQIEYNLVENKINKQISLQIKPKTSFTSLEFSKLCESLNQMITAEEVLVCCNSIQEQILDTYDSLNSFLSEYIKDLA